MEFEWDEIKNQKNYAKHGISFELACKVFEDPLAAFILERVENGEERWQAIGQAGNLPLLVVVHTYRDYRGREKIRIISARQASTHERKRYESE